MKRLFAIKPRDWVSFIFPDLTEVNIKAMPTDMVSKIKNESRMDNVKQVNDEFILHIEPMSYHDSSLPYRMLRYRADIWEYMSLEKKDILSIKQVVIFFLEQHDNNLNNLEDFWDSEKTLNFSYKVVKVWELDSQDIINRKLEALYPLIPLARQDDKASDDDIIKSALRLIYTVEDSALRADLLSVMSILAAEKFSKQLIKKYVQREMLMQSALFEEWIADFIEEAEEKGIEKGKMLGKEEGKQEGKIEAKKEIAKELLQDGESAERVAKIIKLPVENIIELQRQLIAVPRNDKKA
jgi:predicted transposase YdaD